MMAVVLALGLWLVAVLVVVGVGPHDLPCWALGLALAVPLAAGAWRLRRASDARTALILATVTVLAMPMTTWMPVHVTVAGFGFTVIGACPLPATDLVVRSNGEVRFRAKSHVVMWGELAPLARDASVIVVATGWQGVVQVDDEATQRLGARLVILENPVALLRYEALRRAGLSVALLFHSTC